MQTKTALNQLARDPVTEKEKTKEKRFQRNAKKARSKNKSSPKSGENPYDYILVGNDFYRLTLDPDEGNTSAIPSLKLCHRKEARINALFPDKGLKSLIPAFVDFTFDPDNLNYTRSVVTHSPSGKVDHLYNRYEPLRYKPAPGDIAVTMSFLRHIFGDALPVALDYLHLLYVKPKVRLPILVLVSRERNTGKSTFLRWLNEQYGRNMQITTDGDMRSRFNGDLSDKLIIGVEESNLDRKADMEYLKNYSTSEWMRLELKGQDRSHVRNYTHFIICSNNEETPVKIDQEENRFLVIKVPLPPHDDPTLLVKLRAEIPAFENYLVYEYQMKYSQSQGRLYFPAEALNTPALEKIKNASLPDNQYEVANFLLDLMDRCGQDVIKIGCLDLQKALAEAGIRQNHLSRLLNNWVDRYGIDKGNTSFVTYIADGNCLSAPQKVKGRYYEFTRDFLTKYFG